MDIHLFLLTFALGALFTVFVATTSPWALNWIIAMYDGNDRTLRQIARWWRNRRERR